MVCKKYTLSNVIKKKKKLTFDVWSLPFAKKDDDDANYCGTYNYRNNGSNNQHYCVRVQLLPPRCVSCRNYWIKNDLKNFGQSTWYVNFTRTAFTNTVICVTNVSPQTTKITIKYYIAAQSILKCWFYLYSIVFHTPFPHKGDEVRICKSRTN